MKNKEILKNYLYWTIAFLGCMLIGIIRTYAITFTDFTDVHSNTQVLVEYSTGSSPVNWPYNNSSLYQNDVRKVNFIIGNYTFQANTHYEFESHMLGKTFKDQPIYTVTPNNSNATCITDSYYLNFINGEYPRWDFQCNQNVSSVTITIFNSNNSVIMDSGYFGWGSAIISKSSTPINSTNNDTDMIINNNNYNTNQIIDNSNQNTQQIIDNQNNIYYNKCPNLLNIKDFFKGRINPSTGQIEYSNNTTSLTTTDSSLTFTTSMAWNSGATSEFIPVTAGTYTYSAISNKKVYYYIDAYDASRGYIERVTSGNQTGSALKSFTISSNIKYIRLHYEVASAETFIVDNIQIEKGSSNTSFCVIGSSLSNKLDETNNSINNLNDTLNNDDVDDNGIADSFEDFNDYLDDNSTITRLLTLPITLFTAILNNVNGTCQPFNLGALYGENLILPCINVSQYLGNTLWTMIDVIISGFAIYAISKKMIKIFNNFSSLKEGDVIDD